MLISLFCLSYEHPFEPGTKVETREEEEDAAYLSVETAQLRKVQQPHESSITSHYDDSLGG